MVSFWMTLYDSSKEISWAVIINRNLIRGVEKYLRGCKMKQELVNLTAWLNIWKKYVAVICMSLTADKVIFKNPNKGELKSPCQLIIQEGRGQEEGEALAFKRKMLIRILCGILKGNLCIMICSFQWHSLQKKQKKQEWLTTCFQWVTTFRWTKGDY